MTSLESSSLNRDFDILGSDQAGMVLSLSKLRAVVDNKYSSVHCESSSQVSIDRSQTGSSASLHSSREVTSATRLPVHQYSLSTVVRSRLVDVYLCSSVQQQRGPRRPEPHGQLFLQGRHSCCIRLVLLMFHRGLIFEYDRAVFQHAHFPFQHSGFKRPRTPFERHRLGRSVVAL